jgi:hypothetical protein
MLILRKRKNTNYNNRLPFVTLKQSYFKNTKEKKRKKGRSIDHFEMLVRFDSLKNIYDIFKRTKRSTKKIYIKKKNREDTPCSLKTIKTKHSIRYLLKL